jgi:hypothetical protein
LENRPNPTNNDVHHLPNLEIKMPPKTLAVICFVLAAISAFVAWERYQDNAKKVEAAKRMMESSPMGGMMEGMMQQMTGESELKAAMPTISKYAIAVAVLASIGGVFFLTRNSSGRHGKSQQSRPTT